MATRELNDLDREILYALQSEARRTSSTDIAESLYVSASTVRNRIQQLEANGVLQRFEEKTHDFSRGMNLTIPTQSFLDSTAQG